MVGSMETNVAQTWHKDSLRAVSKLTPFQGASSHWQDKALACFLEEGFPSRHVEEWKYTDLKPILAQNFVPAAQYESNVDISEFIIPGIERLVFVDGWISPELSSFQSDTSMISILPIFELLSHADETLLREFRIELDRPYFACLNSALMRQGCYIKIKPSQTLQAPLHILHVHTQRDQTVMSHPRYFIDVDKNAEAVIFEEHVSLANQCYLTNVVTQINLNFDARLKYYKLQREAMSAHHLATTIVSQSADSDFQYHVFSKGASVSREDLYLRHYERGAHAKLFGFARANGNQKMTQHTRVDHLRGGCTTDQRYKGIADGQSRVAFDGKMVVHPGSQKSAILQTSNNLLLSNKAEIDAKPNLEIYADDIQASHGATVGQLDEEMLFYLRSRGISESQARKMLISGFASSLFDDISENVITKHIRHIMLDEG